MKLKANLTTFQTVHTTCVKFYVAVKYMIYLLNCNWVATRWQ